MSFKNLQKTGRCKADSTFANGSGEVARESFGETWTDFG